MKTEPGYEMLDRRRGAVLKRMAKVGPFMMATPVKVKVQCGSRRCECAKSKQARHEKLHLSWTDAQGSGTQYVPVDLREEVIEWIHNYWVMKEHLKEMTGLSRKMIQLYVKTRKRRKKKEAT